MRTRVIAALILTIVCAPTLFANCQDCVEYFDPQALRWCLTCAWSDCGFFQCTMHQYGGVLDFCAPGPPGNDECFTPNVGCVAEPMALNFDRTWRLKDVRVTRSQKTTEPAAATSATVG